MDPICVIDSSDEEDGEPTSKRLRIEPCGALVDQLKISNVKSLANSNPPVIQKKTNNYPPGPTRAIKTQPKSAPVSNGTHPRTPIPVANSLKRAAPTIANRPPTLPQTTNISIKSIPKSTNHTSRLTPTQNIPTRTTPNLPKPANILNRTAPISTQTTTNQILNRVALNSAQTINQLMQAIPVVDQKRPVPKIDANTIKSIDEIVVIDDEDPVDVKPIAIQLPATQLLKKLNEVSVSKLESLPSEITIEKVVSLKVEKTKPALEIIDNYVINLLDDSEEPIVPKSELKDASEVNPPAINDIVDLIDEPEECTQIKEVPVLETEESRVVAKDENCPDSTTNAVEFSTEFESFITICLESELSEKERNCMSNRLPKFRQKYLEASDGYVRSRSFLKLLQKSSNKIRVKPRNSLIVFNEVYEELKARKQKDVQLTEKNEKHLQKLYVCLEKLNKKIRKLREADVDLDDDNSPYVQLERYEKRINLVYKKICEYTKEHPYANRTLYNNLNFDSSNYREINRAIDKYYSRHKTMPDYSEVDKVIKKCVKEKNINLSDSALEAEVKKIFLAVCNIIQRRRKHELHTVTMELLDSNTYTDPAHEHRELDEKLKQQYKIGEKKIEEIMQKYTDLQHTRTEEVSNASSDATSSDSESDNQEN